MGALDDLDRLLIKVGDDEAGFSEIYLHDGYWFIEKLTDAEWLALSDLWKRRPEQWQLFLAQLLDVGPVKERLAILLDMIETRNDELIFWALECLPPDLPEISLSDETVAYLLRKPVRFRANVWLEHRDLPRLLKAAGRPYEGLPRSGRW
jgi:hypothetical protein